MNKVRLQNFRLDASQVTFLNFKQDYTELYISEETFVAADSHSPRWGSYATAGFATPEAAEKAAMEIHDACTVSIKEAVAICERNDARMTY